MVGRQRNGKGVYGKGIYGKGVYGNGVYLAWTEVARPHQYPAVIELSPTNNFPKTNKTKRFGNVSFT